MELLLLFQRESLPRRNFEVIPRRTFDIISEEPLNLFREEPLILFWMKIFKSIRINRFRAVTWPSPVLEILWVSVSRHLAKFSFRDFVGVSHPASSIQHPCSVVGAHALLSELLEAV